MVVGAIGGVPSAATVVVKKIYHKHFLNIILIIKLINIYIYMLYAYFLLSFITSYNVVF